MLAYEMYLNNKAYLSTKNDQDPSQLSRGSPVKKIFVLEKKCKLDDTPIEKYGIQEIDLKNSDLQRVLHLPSSAQKLVGLPDKTTGGNSPKPYVRLHCAYENGRLIISLKKKNEFDWTCTSKLNDEADSEPVFSGNAFVRIDSDHYFMEEKKLREVYIKEGIIDEQGNVDRDIFALACHCLIQFCKGKKLGETLPKGNGTFEVVLLPGKSAVNYKSTEIEKNARESFVDSFGNQSNHYPNSPIEKSKGMKFLSADDPAFTLNEHKKEGFYESIGIGDTSFPYLALPKSELDIAGLKWYFSNLEDPDKTFQPVKTGLYGQLLQNFRELDKEDSTRKKGSLKIMAIKMDSKRSKMEILIDENLTMERLGKILAIRTEKPGDEIKFGLEVLIEEYAGGKSRQSTNWAEYVFAVKSLLREVKIKRGRLVSIFTKRTRDKRQGWIKARFRGLVFEREFFRKADFCLELLATEGKTMKPDEQYAYAIGKIAGEFVRIKRKYVDQNNSTNDILAYQKYDKNTLRFVLQRIGRSTALTKKDKGLGELEQNLHDNLPKDEMTDEREDYAYFFYKGVFEKLGGN
ncbi:MAG: hypothetical protein V1728_06010 [Candidatus Micrarchaeota archaeon]